MWLCGLSSITSMGRMWYAFARDGGMPGSRLLRRIHPRWRTPVPAILVSGALAVAICVYAAAVPVVTSISTIALYLAYGLPISLNLRNRLRAAAGLRDAGKRALEPGAVRSLINGIAVALGAASSPWSSACLPTSSSSGRCFSSAPFSGSIGWRRRGGGSGSPAGVCRPDLLSFPPVPHVPRSPSQGLGVFR